MTGTSAWSAYGSACVSGRGPQSSSQRTPLVFAYGAAVVTLHDELVAILRSDGNRWMTLQELATAVNARGRYAKRDGSAMGAGQINLRTRAGGSYEHLFERDGQRVRLRGTQPAPVTVASDGRKPPADEDLRGVLEAAVAALTEPRHPLAKADAVVPLIPGLYSIYGGSAEWAELGLGEPTDDRPLYVGKSESSLADRDLRTHFGNGRTGSSTVRRTFAALLHDSLGLRGMPRNPARPERFASYGLSPEHDRLLTDWMRSRLALAVWPGVRTASLITVERAVLQRWQPPLNLKDAHTPWSATISAARRVMATEARAYAARAAP